MIISTNGINHFKISLVVEDNINSKVNPREDFVRMLAGLAAQNITWYFLKLKLKIGSLSTGSGPHYSPHVYSYSYQKARHKKQRRAPNLLTVLIL